MSEDKARASMEAIERHGGNVAAAANELGLHPNSVLRHRRWWQDHNTDPAMSFQTCMTGRVAKTTTQIGPNGVERVWERRVPFPEIDAVERLHERIDDLEPLEPVKLACKARDEDLMVLYTLADLHAGMLSWKPESGADWDSKICKETIEAAMDHLVVSSPRSRRATISILGDIAHYDKLDSVTTASGHVLDSDSRYHKIADLCIDLTIHTVERVLQYHEEVDLVVIEGNHDAISSVWLRKLLARLLSANPRVTVPDIVKPYHASKWGKCFLGFHHGHVRDMNSPAKLVALFCQEFADLWGGNGAPRYIHLGHRHFKQVDGSEGVIIQQHATLAARSSYDARSGYQAQRNMEAIAYHRNFGEWSSVKFNPAMIGAQASFKTHGFARPGSHEA